MKTFDELFEEFFNKKNSDESKKKNKKEEKPKNEGFSDELSKLIKVLSNARQITDDDEKFKIDTEYGEPTRVEYYHEDELYFKKSIWEVEDGEIVKIEVSDMPFELEDPKSLEELLEEAIQAEEYEKAAELRDEINKNKKN